MSGTHMEELARKRPLHCCEPQCLCRLQAGSYGDHLLLPSLSHAGDAHVGACPQATPSLL